jgi:hypothetical protein
MAYRDDRPSPRGVLRAPSFCENVRLAKKRQIYSFRAPHGWASGSARLVGPTCARRVVCLRAVAVG